MRLILERTGSLIMSPQTQVDIETLNELFVDKKDINFKPCEFKEYVDRSHHPLPEKQGQGIHK